MRRKLIFGALASPAPVLAAFSLWAHTRAAAEPNFEKLGMAVREGLALNGWAVRLMPFLIISLSIVWPLVVVAIAAATGEALRNRTTSRDVLRWWYVSVASLIVLFVGAGIWYMHDPKHSDPPTAVLVSIGWIGVVAFWISMAAAYSIQHRKYATHESRWHPKWLLGGVALLSCVGLGGLPLIAAIAFRKDERSQVAG
jgi:hypothetical protein